MGGELVTMNHESVTTHRTTIVNRVTGIKEYPLEYYITGTTMAGW